MSTIKSAPFVVAVGVAFIFSTGMAHGQERQSQTLARSVALDILNEEGNRLVLFRAWEVRIPSSFTIPTVRIYRTKEEAPLNYRFDPAKLDEFLPRARPLARLYAELTTAGVLLPDVSRPDTASLVALGAQGSGSYRYIYHLHVVPRPGLPDIRLENRADGEAIIVSTITPQVLRITGIAQDGPQARVEAEVGTVDGKLTRTFEYFYYAANRTIILERLRGQQVPVLLRDIMEAAAAAAAPRARAYQMRHYDDGWRLVPARTTRDGR